eukprot:g11458.t1
MINSLQWRQAHSKDDLYPLPMDSGVLLEFRQLQAGEVTGLGTGATVWPAAHVLAKYLERRFPDAGVGEGRRGMEGLRAVDLGSGTGVAGIVAAALGADVFLTDQEQLLFLMEENAERAARAKARKPEEHAGTSSSSTNAEPGAFGEISVLTYDWGMDDDRLSPPVDVVLVSDCVLPKLYPIEPLVDAIDRLSGPDTVTIMSYEHRHYQAFDPRRRFEELAAAKGLVKVDVPQARQHPIFSADDIEIWEVRRRQQQAQQDADCCQPAQQSPAHAGGATGPESALVEALGCTAQDVVILSSSTASLPASVERVTAAGEAKHEVQTVVSILGERHELAQTPSGAIGCYLWPSAVVMARHLVVVAASAAANTPSARDVPRDGDANPPGGGAPAWSLLRGRVLELGSGVGLVAMTAALLGWEVVSTDKADALPLLALNVDRCLSSTRREHVGKVDVVGYEWGTDAQHLLTDQNSAGNPSAAGITGYDVVICADCVYAGASVEPLLASLCEVCDEHTCVLVTNELRSAFDEFLRRARALNFEVEDIHVPEAHMVVDQAKNQRPKPVALKRLRRRAT